MTLRPAKVPCASCPYRRDVPVGIWHASEYRKLPHYDGETWEQSPHLFMCHQRNGCLCSGWLACHDPRELLALRLHVRNIDPSTFRYSTDVPVFASGREALCHGMGAPDQRARRLMTKLIRKVKPR